MQMRWAKAWVSVTEVVEHFPYIRVFRTALHGHHRRATQCRRLLFCCNPHSSFSVLPWAGAACQQSTAHQLSLRLYTASTCASHPQGAEDASGAHANSRQHAAPPSAAVEAAGPDPYASSAPGSVVIGFDDTLTSTQAPSWAPSLVQGRLRRAPEGAHKLSSETLPADPDTLFPAATPRPRVLPNNRHWRDWLERAKTIEQWLRLVETDLLRPNVSNEDVSYVHISSANHALSVLIDGIVWREGGTSAPRETQVQVNNAISQLARRIEHWPTCNNNEDIANFLWRLQQLCLVKCPDHMKKLREDLTKTRPAEGLSIVQALLNRASSLPLVFEDRIATQRLCGIVYNTAALSPTFFSNLADYLEATTPKPEFMGQSPVLAPRRGRPAGTVARVTGQHGTRLPEESAAMLGPLPEVLEADGMTGEEPAAVPRQLALEAAAAARDPLLAAAQVPPQKAGIANTGYTQRTLNMIAGACANVVQTHGAAAQPLKGHMQSIFRSIGQRWLDLIFEGAKSQPHTFTFFLTAHSKCRISAEPHVLTMMLKQAVIVLKDCDPQGVSTIMSALAFLCNPKDPDARAVFCVAHAQLLRVLRTHIPRTQYAANVSCHASWAFGAMNFAPSLHLSKLMCEAVTEGLLKREQMISMQQLCAFLWGLTKVSHLQESSGNRGSGSRLSDVYGGSGRGWQRRKAAPSSAQIWQESIMPVVRAAQEPAARHIRTLHPDYSRAVSMLMWSHAQLRRQPFAVLTSAVIKHAEGCAGAYSMQGSTNLVWALHTLMPTVPAVPRATTQRIASTLASHGVNVLRLVDRDLSTRKHDIGKLRTGLQACAVTLSSLVSRHALMDEAIPLELVHNMLDRIETCLRACIDKFGTAAVHNEVCMVQQTFDVLNQLGLANEVQQHADLWTLVKSYVQKANTAPVFKDFAAPSVLQHSVAACMRKLHSSNWFPAGTTVQEEVKLGLQRYVDILVTVPATAHKPQRRIAVEVDGPHHFTAALQPDGPAAFARNNTWPDGPTQLRNWSLQRLDLEVVDIRYYETSHKSARFAAESKYAGSASRPSPAMMQLVARKMREVLGPDFGTHRGQRALEPAATPPQWSPRLPAGYAASSPLHDAEPSRGGSVPVGGRAVNGKRLAVNGGRGIDVPIGGFAPPDEGTG
eukprot:jgi/Ulvmu1/6233/UM028_0091.1